MFPGLLLCSFSIPSLLSGARLPARAVTADACLYDKGSAVEEMLMDLFGSESDLLDAAQAWRSNNMHAVAESLVPPPVRSPMPQPQMSQPMNLWLRLTRLLSSNGKLTGMDDVHAHAGRHSTNQRLSLNKWDAEVATMLASSHLREGRCAETGDGHFLKEHYREICGSQLSLDKFNPKADVKLDLGQPPDDADDAVKQLHGTMDLIVSHQVFEHLPKPSLGITHVNAMLKMGAQLVFSTPFIFQDHPSPHDFFRYTVRNVWNLLTCGGFELQTLQGRGSKLTSLTLLAHIPGSELTDDELYEFCDGLTTNYCEDRYYTLVVATAIKAKTVNMTEVSDCFG